MNDRKADLRKISILFLLVAFLVVGNAFAQNKWQASLESAVTQQGLTMAEFSDIYIFYYKNPQPDKLILVLKTLLTINDLISDQEQFGSHAHFFATVAHNNKAFFEKLSLLKDTCSGLSKQALETILQGAERFTSPDPDSPDHLDYLWSEFLATGDAAPVKKIISVLGYSNPDKDNPNEPTTKIGVLIYVADWSLGSNALQHEAIKKILEQEEASAAEPIKSKLKAILILNDIQK